MCRNIATSIGGRPYSVQHTFTTAREFDLRVFNGYIAAIVGSRNFCRIRNVAAISGDVFGCIGEYRSDIVVVFQYLNTITEVSTDISCAIGADDYSFAVIAFLNIGKMCDGYVTTDILSSYKTCIRGGYIIHAFVTRVCRTSCKRRTFFINYRNDLRLSSHIAAIIGCCPGSGNNGRTTFSIVSKYPAAMLVQLSSA